MVYQLALFIHIVGVLVMFAGITIEVFVLMGLGRAQTLDQMRVWLRGARGASKLFPLATALILIAGAYMAVTTWHSTAWIDAGLFTLIALAIVGRLVNGRRFAALAKTAFSITNGSITAELRRQLDDPTLRTSVSIMSSTALGVIFLMVLKPEWPGSLATMGVALVAGWLVAALIHLRHPVGQSVVAELEGASAR